MAVPNREAGPPFPQWNLEHAISISYEGAPRSYGETYAKLASIERARGKRGKSKRESPSRGSACARVMVPHVPAVWTKWVCGKSASAEFTRSAFGCEFLETKGPTAEDRDRGMELLWGICASVFRAAELERDMDTVPLSTAWGNHPELARR